MYNKNIVSAGALLVLVLGTTMIVRLSIQAESLTPVYDIDALSTNIHMEGDYVCLPFKNGRVAMDEETCEMGLRTTGDMYYGLDTHLIPENAVKSLIRGKGMKANGVLSPGGNIPANHPIQKYGVNGIFTITDSLYSK